MTIATDPILVDKTWVFPDGRTLPLITGGSDAGDTGGGEAAAAPAPAPAAAPAAAPAPAAADAPATPSAAADSALDGDIPDEPMFSRGYVSKLREEGRTYREQARAAQEALSGYQEAFDGYEPEDVEVWKNLATTWKSSPADAANMMQRIVASVLGGGDTGDDVADELAGDLMEATANEGPGELTEERIQQIVADSIAQREAAEAEAAEQKAAVDAVFAEIKAADIDPQSKRGFAILWAANNEHNGDVAAAIEADRAERQAIIDDYLAGKTGVAPAPNDGVLATEATPVHTFDDAKDGLRNFLKGRQTIPG